MKGASNLQFFVIMIALLITFTILFSAFSYTFAQINCPEEYGTFAGQDINETYGESVPKNPIGIIGYVTSLFDQRCSGIPIWFTLMILIPLLVGAIWYVIPTFSGKLNKISIDKLFCRVFFICRIG